jgi:mRNA deadenylase 3'-5' endonuclease subunit Ccr4
VKLIQTMMLMDQLKKIQEDAATTFRPGQKYDPAAIQLLLCGDFNSLPNSGKTAPKLFVFVFIVLILSLFSRRL